MSFYRKYRPQVLEEIDNEKVREALAALLSKDRGKLPHAYLFSGPKGTGKTTAARLIAKLFNCEKIKKSGPCGECDNCSSIANGSNLDVLEIDAASNRGIDEIRELRQRIGLVPVSAAYKVYIIDEVHMLTNEAFNALLKTLEEPPPHAVFVLATTDVQKVPATVISRCLTIIFQRATSEELVHALERIVRGEKITVDSEALTIVAQHADGSFRDAAKMLEQLSFQGSKITGEVARQTLALSGEGQRREFLKYLAAKNVKEALETIAEIVKQGRDIKLFLVDCLSELERMLVGQIFGKPADGWERETLQQAIEKLSTAYVNIRLSPIPQLPLELAVVEFCGPEVIQKENTTGLLTLEKLSEYWPDFIVATKPYNHSVAGVLRSSRPKLVENGIVTIEAFYKFHQEKLSEVKTKQILSDILKKLFGEKVKIEVVLGKK